MREHKFGYDDVSGEIRRVHFCFGADLKWPIDLSFRAKNEFGYNVSAKSSRLDLMMRCRQRFLVAAEAVRPALLEMTFSGVDLNSPINERRLYPSKSSQNALW